MKNAAICGKESWNFSIFTNSRSTPSPNGKLQRGVIRRVSLISHSVYRLSRSLWWFLGPTLQPAAHLNDELHWNFQQASTRDNSPCFRSGPVEWFQLFTIHSHITFNTSSLWKTGCRAKKQKKNPHKGSQPMWNSRERSWKCGKKLKGKRWRVNNERMQLQERTDSQSARDTTFLAYRWWFFTSFNDFSQMLQ